MRGQVLSYRDWIDRRVEIACQNLMTIYRHFIGSNDPGGMSIDLYLGLARWELKGIPVTTLDVFMDYWSNGLMDHAEVIKKKPLLPNAFNVVMVNKPKGIILNLNYAHDLGHQKKTKAFKYAEQSRTIAFSTTYGESLVTLKNTSSQSLSLRDLDVILRPQETIQTTKEKSQRILVTGGMFLTQIGSEEIDDWKDFKVHISPPGMTKEESIREVKALMVQELIEKNL